MIQAHLPCGNPFRSPAPAHGERGRHHRVQPQGGHRIPQGLDLCLWDAQRGPLNLRNRQPDPAGLPPLPQEKVPQAGRGNDIRAVGRHQDIPHPFPGHAQSHQAPQDIPVGQAFRAVERGPQIGKLIRPVLRPLRQEDQNFPLRLLIAAIQDEPVPHPGGVQHSLC